jgi:cell division protease FtsH
MWQNVMGGNRPGGSKDSPGKLAKGAKGNEPLVTFNDIEGIDTAKFEVMELVDTLRNPDKYKILGARAPTGLLLEGPPGKFSHLFSNLYLIENTKGKETSLQTTFNVP